MCNMRHSTEIIIDEAMAQLDLVSSGSSSESSIVYFSTISDIIHEVTGVMCDITQDNSVTYHHVHSLLP